MFNAEVSKNIIKLGLLAIRSASRGCDRHRSIITSKTGPECLFNWDSVQDQRSMKQRFLTQAVASNVKGDT